MALDRREARRRLFELAAGQGGHFSASQALEIGYSHQAQAHHVAAGNWLRVGHGLFRLAEWVPQLHDDLGRWALWAKLRAVVSHESALAVHGVGELESGKVHLTVPPGFRKRDDAVMLHFADLPRGDVVDGPGFRLTTLVRTVIDVAALSADEDQLARLIDDGRDRGLLTVRQLRTRAEVVDPRAALHIERALPLTGPT